MNKHIISLKNKFDILKKARHNEPKGCYAEKEEDIMTKMLEKINNIELSPRTLHELGMDKNWRDKVSSELTCKVVKTARKYRDVLKELSKY